jgi:division protein CdvB (Snf7/Vps24/ESCRT-III family)
MCEFRANYVRTDTANRLTLQEATILARVTDGALQTQGSQNSLRLRVQGILGEMGKVVSGETMTSAVQKVDELLEVAPEDTRHLFFEEIRNLFYALKEIEPEEVTEADLERFSEAADQVFNVIQAIRAHRKRSTLPRPFSL